MKKIIAAMLALCLSVCLFGCGGKGGATNGTTIQPKPEAEPEETFAFYVLTEVTNYSADGSQGFLHATYTYTNAGLPLTVWEDRGTAEEIWDEEAQVYYYTEIPCDGTVDISHSYRYDSEGSLIGQEQEYTYEYDAQGLPKSCYAQAEGGAYTLYYRYDAEGRLERLEQSSGGKDHLQAAFRYDEEGRLAGCFGYSGDTAVEYGYQYGEDGELVGMTYGSLPASEVTEPFSGVAVERNTEFEYDKDGRLVSRKQFSGSGDLLESAVCEYTAMGKLSRICYFYADGNLDDPFTYQHSMDGHTVCVWTHKDNTVTRFTYDENGNLVRRDESDGSYTLYQYQALQLTAKQLQKAQQAAGLLGGIDADGESNPLLRYSPEQSYGMLLALPQSSLHQTDLLRK